MSAGTRFRALQPRPHAQREKRREWSVYVTAFLAAHGLLLAMGASPQPASAQEKVGQGMAAAVSTSANTSPAPASNQQTAQCLLGDESKKLKLEIEKLELENVKLREDRASWLNTPWLAALSAFMGGLVATGAALWAARRSRLGTFDQAVLEKRLETHGSLVDATEPLALYFPTCVLSPAKCKEVGDKLRACYFSGTGVLLSEDARDRYFTLAQALTSAAVAKEIDVPSLDDYPQWISKEQIDEYRVLLGLQGENEELNDEALRACVEGWCYGKTAAAGWQGLRMFLRERQGNSSNLPCAPEVELVKKGKQRPYAAALLFQDFVLLQTLTSRLRTALTEDIRGRRRPA